MLIYFENDAITHFVGVLILGKSCPWTQNLTGREEYEHLCLFHIFIH